MFKLWGVLVKIIMHYGERGANRPSYHGAFEPTVPHSFRVNNK